MQINIDMLHEEFKIAQIPGEKKYSPDFKRLEIRYSFSLIVAFACLCLSSRSNNVCSVSSSFFCGRDVQSLHNIEWEK